MILKYFGNKSGFLGGFTMYVRICPYALGCAEAAPTGRVSSPGYSCG